MTIILIIAGMVLAASSAANKMAKKNRCQAQINAVEIALEQYKSEWGFYPESLDTTNKIASFAWWDSLAAFPVDVDTDADGIPDTTIQKPLIDNTVIGMIEDSTHKYVDPYGNPFFYEPDPTSGMNTEKFDLWSMGHDGSHGDGGTSPADAQSVNAENSDDVKNWGKQ